MCAVHFYLTHLTATSLLGLVPDIDVLCIFSMRKVATGIESLMVFLWSSAILS